MKKYLILLISILMCAGGIYTTSAQDEVKEAAVVTEEVTPATPIPLPTPLEEPPSEEVIATEEAVAVTPEPTEAEAVEECLLPGIPEPPAPEKETVPAMPITPVPAEPTEMGMVKELAEKEVAIEPSEEAEIPSEEAAVADKEEQVPDISKEEMQKLFVLLNELLTMIKPEIKGMVKEIRSGKPITEQETETIPTTPTEPIELIEDEGVDEKISPDTSKEVSVEEPTALKE